MAVTSTVYSGRDERQGAVVTDVRNDEDAHKNCRAHLGIWKGKPVACATARLHGDEPKRMMSLMILLLLWYRELQGFVLYACSSRTLLAAQPSAMFRSFPCWSTARLNITVCPAEGSRAEGFQGWSANASGCSYGFLLRRRSDSYEIHGVDSKVAKELSVISCPPNWVTKL